LILSSWGGILPSQNRKKPLWFLLAWQMKRKTFEVGAINALRGQRKELPPKDFRKPVHPSIGIRPAILICEPLFA